MTKYKVYLVGAGPGDPGLITAKGLEILRQADVIIYDYLVDKRILEEAKEGAELICCDTLGKDRYSDGFLIHNERIWKLVVKKSEEGKKVIRLKNGDPSIFSRASQELEPLVENKIEFEIVPGVTAASAAGCLSGIPLTDRRFASSCVFVTGHTEAGKGGIDWGSLSKQGTIILYMAVENLPKIVKSLVNAGKNKDTPVALIQDVSLLTQKVMTGALRDIVSKAKSRSVKPPAIIIIGETASLEKRFNWLRKSKLVLFTGLSEKRFFERGKIYFHLPLIKIVPLESYEEFDGCLKDIQQFDWLIFASRYGVEYFFKRFAHIGYDSRLLTGIKIAAIGNSTKARLLDFGIIADLVPEKESSEGLIEEFKTIGIKGKKLFMPRSDISDKGLSNGLKKLGAEVTAGFAYRNIMPANLPDLDLKFFDEIMFTSPSTARNFRKRYGRVPKGVKVTCVGEATKKEYGKIKAK
ncbi:MAG: uroporphyrinogen-III C-methyltransferase [Candidatus Omnitrophica bacterium]|nr:uroporphyrinogen-III C-methyltransferase [Candidatus Omnitrophota bacterium]